VISVTAVNPAPMGAAAMAISSATLKRQTRAQKPATAMKP
jgi:hypothetical protein